MLSELRKRERANAAVIDWARSLGKDAEVYVSVLVVGEIRRGIANIGRRDEKAAKALADWLDGLVALLGTRILPVTQAIAERWGGLSAPDRLPVVDDLLAATALVHGLTLVTRNTADVARTGVRLLNPFVPRA